ncbi:tRNA pseudouridine synthase 1 [Smittium culicis]|uniref:tRNA pseudouridine synthase 1 n=1 Tax=Smittium culicis TaxID=133412 RepID=A0A1R1XZW6_9FUNG|nr:tRNA pseudouridine synthase 1 [Smittium culicis]
MINSDLNNTGADPAPSLPDTIVSSEPALEQDKSAAENKRKDHPEPEKDQNTKKINKAQSCVDRKNHFLKNSRNNSTKTDEKKKNTRNYEASQNPNPGSSEPRKPKKNVVLYCSYCGTGYQGMQANPNAKTIEGEIFTALCKAGAVSEQNSDDQKKVQMQRAARTDKGVHAAGQIVSLKMITEDPDVISKINSFLPDQIRIWGYSPVIRSFNPKTLCDSRIYEYLLPTYVFMPPDEEIVNLVNTKTYAERQELYTFFKAKESANSDAEEAGEQDDDTASKRSEGKKLAPADLADSYEATNKPEIIEKHSTIAQSKRAAFRLDAESLKQLKEGFSMYVGTHDFLNFTVTKGTTGKNSPRFIKSISVSDPMIIGDGEWLSIKIHGQSFMLHQIRKMVGGADFCLMILLLRSKTPLEIINKIYETKRRINIPKAPGLGLLLERPVYDSYSKRIMSMPRKNNNEVRESIAFDRFDDEVLAFKQKFIYDRINQDEVSSGKFNQWTELCDVFPEQYPYLNADGIIPESAYDVLN